MLRDFLPSRQDFNNDPVFMEFIAVTEDSYDHDHHRNADPLDDVFGSAPSSPVFQATEESRRHESSDISDIHRLRNTHVTSGYRDGIAESKEKFMQDGFDEGYSLGAELGLKVGWCLGALEGIWHALKCTQATHADAEISRFDVAKMYVEAEKQLQMQKLFAAEFFGEDGIWLYEVHGNGTSDDDVTFKDVAAAHPVVHEWREKLLALAQTLVLGLK